MCAVQSSPRIATDRLVLRRPGLQDAARIADLINDLDVARMLTRVPHPYALANAEDFIARMAGSSDKGDQALVVEHREMGAIGMVGLHPQPEPSDIGFTLQPELGYWLGRTFWGRGFATEAVAAVLTWAREALGFRAVASGHFADNPASGRVLAKADFLYTGEVQTRLSLARQDVVPARMMVWLA
ncbi:MAG: GNAT family N-acetyltransferase [Caulobacteraceae bacterium]